MEGPVSYHAGLLCFRMNRRRFIAALVCLPVLAEAPTDARWYDRLDAFLIHMNAFVKRLNSRVFDSKLWDRCKAAWQRLL